MKYAIANKKQSGVQTLNISQLGEGKKSNNFSDL